MHEGVEIGPGETVPLQILTTWAFKLILKLTKSGGNCQLCMVLHTSFILGEEQFDAIIDQILIHQRVLTLFWRFQPNQSTWRYILHTPATVKGTHRPT